jgi:hypothetical protein
MLLFSCVLFDRNFTCSSQFSDFSCWRYIPFKLAHRARTQAGVAERYTRLSQKQVPQGLRVRISPPALLVHRYLPLSSPASTGLSKVYQGLLKSTVVYRVCCQFCCQRGIRKPAVRELFWLSRCGSFFLKSLCLERQLQTGTVLSLCWLYGASVLKTRLLMPIDPASLQGELSYFTMCSMK